jgi:hypothetical protein
MSEFDPVQRPKHYNVHPSGIEVIEITQHFDFCVGNALKYVMRCDHKGATVQDLEKARWYMKRAEARRTVLRFDNRVALTMEKYLQHEPVGGFVESIFRAVVRFEYGRAVAVLDAEISRRKAQ